MVEIINWPIVLRNPALSLISRILLASVGSYGVAVAADLACLALPIDRISAVFWGQMLSVLVCAAMIILAFSTQTASRAWLYGGSIAATLLAIWYFLAP